MGFIYTPDQQKVIDLRDRNILVSAAAGSGKTAVLVERIIRMVCDEEHPVDIDRLLIVTFTKAAAAEMRERISAGIAGVLSEHPESEHIARQATLLHNAQITTIDSFCLYILRNHFNEIGLDPAFRIADEGEIKLLSADVMDALMEDCFTERRAEFTEMVEFFCPSGKERLLEEHIRELFKVACSNPWPREWLLDRKEDYSIATVEELEQAEFARLLTGQLQKICRDIHREYKSLLALCQEPDGPYMYAEMVEEECKMAEKLLTCGSLTEFSQAFDRFSFGRLSSKKDESVNGDKRQLAKEKRDALKKLLVGTAEKYFSLPLETVVSHMQKCSVAVNALVNVTVEYYDRLQAAKQEKKLVDFSDMEHYALEILLKREGEDITPSNVAREYQEYFHEILIDEYQDSNLVQEFLLKAISGEESGKYNRFMVGDVKQSIYKFRLARPDLFLEKLRCYTHEESRAQRIDLSQNFRSRSEVIRAVNGIFEGLMDVDKGGIVYDKDAALYVGAKYESAPGMEGELLLMEESGTLGLSGKELEAELIAGRIEELQGSLLVTDKETGKLRPVHYKDIVILLRTTSGWDEEFKKVLEKHGIPVFITSKTGYFSATEVQELLAFLRVLDNPTQDIPLYGVLKSVFGGFSEEQIALVRCKDKKSFLWENLCLYAEAGEDALLRERCEFFRGQVEKYRQLSIYMPIRRLLETLVDEYHYLEYVFSMPGGSKRKANVEMLFTKASDFESTSYFGLFHFVRYIEKLEKYDVDFGEADVLDENADVVRIMSIHKSKGLEFPVTIVAGMGKRFNMQDTRSSFLLDADLGIGTDYVNHKERYRVKNLRRMALSEKMREENLAEELRVLYVALTRPKEKLIMTGCVKNAQELLERYIGQQGRSLSYMEFMNAAGYLDYLLPVLPQEHVRVQAFTEEHLMAGQATEQISQEEKRYLLEHSGELVSEVLLKELGERFSYHYAHENLAQLHTKTSVSELKMAAMAEKDEAAFEVFESREEEKNGYLPRFAAASEKQVSATTRGNAFHKAMEVLDFRKIVFEGADIRELLQCRLEEGRLSEEFLGALSMRKLRNFFQTALAREMAEATGEGRLFREQPFVYSIAANRLKEEFPETERVLIQGIIDAFYIKDDRIILVDYKTDRVESGAQLWDRYETQMSYYKEALEHLLGLPVEKAVLYSFSLESCEEKSYM